jgi:transcription initiation factor TFIIF subunit alpha
MEFASGLSIDAKDWKSIEMRREINPYTYRPASNIDPNAASSSTITTSLGVVLPKTGAGSEYGREQKEALKRKRYAVKGTNIEDLPWILTDRSSTEKKLKHYRGLKKGGVTTNSSYYVFIQGKDGFEAYPVEDWYGFTPTNVYKTLDFDEAEKQYQERYKHLSKWFLKHQVTKEKGDDDEIEDEDGVKGKKTINKTKRDLKLLDAEEWINDKEEEEEEDDEPDDEDGNDKSNKKSKTNKKNEKKVKGAWTLSDDDDEDEANQAKVKKQKTNKRQTSEDQAEDSDDGDHDGNNSKRRLSIPDSLF